MRLSTNQLVSLSTKQLINHSMSWLAGLSGGESADGLLLKLKMNLLYRCRL
jgi:hypothetical protein